MKQYFFFILLLLSLNRTYPDGFAANTYIKTLKGKVILKQLCDDAREQEELALSYDFNPVHSHYTFNKVINAAQSTTNCYIVVNLGQDSLDNIVCTPMQEFYLPEKKRWTSAYLLKSGDLLLSEGFKLKEVINVKLIQQPLDVYSIEVEDVHNFFVSRHSILTHNMFVPIGLSITTAFGSGATAGGSAGSYFGPVTFCIGGIVGGLLGLGYKVLFCDSKLPKYKLDYHVDDVNASIEKNTIYFENNKLINTKFDLLIMGVKTPGKPAIEDGFEPKRNWNGEKQKHPKTGQIGYPDNKGNYWIPSGNHGGQHWDVVDKTGKDYVNVYPGGKTRPGQRKK